MKKRLNTPYELRVEPRSHGNKEEVPSTVSRRPYVHKSEAEDRQSVEDGTAKPPLVVKPNLKMIVWKKLPVQMSPLPPQNSNDLRENPGTRDNEGDVPSIIGPSPGENDSGARRRHSSDEEKKQTHAVTPK